MFVGRAFRVTVWIARRDVKVVQHAPFLDEVLRNDRDFGQPLQELGDHMTPSFPAPNARGARSFDSPSPARGL